MESLARHLQFGPTVLTHRHLPEFFQLAAVGEQVDANWRRGPRVSVLSACASCGGLEYWVADGAVAVGGGVVAGDVDDAGREAVEEVSVDWK